MATYPQEKIDEFKLTFALELLRNPDNPHTAAFKAIPDSGLALQAANLWVRDPVVLAEQKRLLGEHGEKKFLASKEEQCRKVWELANDANLEPEDRLKAHRLYAELNGNIEKPSATANVNVAVQTVMVVKDHGSNDDWETRAVEQQNKLIQGEVVN